MVNMIMNVLNAWGKITPVHLLACHSVDTGNVAFELISNYFKEQADEIYRDTGTVGGAWIPNVIAHHDIGKMTGDFQGKAPLSIIQPLLDDGLPFKDTKKVGFRHESVSASWMLEHLIFNGWGHGVARMVASAFRGHHGNFNASSIEDEAMKKGWMDAKKELGNIIDKSFPVGSLIPREVTNASVIGVLLSGILILSDWIASNEAFFPRRDVDYVSSIGIDKYVTESSRFANIAVSRLFPGMVPLFENILSFTDAWSGLDALKPVQVTCDNVGSHVGKEPMLVMIEAPTGEGKTEASLYLASRWVDRGFNGIYFALPSMATSNQMHDRVKEFLDNVSGSEQGVRLVHGTAWMIDKKTPIMDRAKHEYYDWFNPLKRALLSPFAVGTVDQLLMSVLKVKFGVLRLLGISRKVIIIDEVHAYDAYMSRVLTRVLEWASALSIPVILLSATLPCSKREMLCRSYGGNLVDIDEGTSLMDYPLVTTVSLDGKRKMFPVDGGISRHVKIFVHDAMLGNPERIAQLSVFLANNGSCVCVVTNTVRSAQEIYRDIKKIDVDGVIVKRLFHSRFIASRRNEIETDIVRMFGKNGNERPAKAILVATQVVEQSLDLDFDEMITDIAPIDFMLQRIGRVHRHERDGRSGAVRLHVAAPGTGWDFGASSRVYDDYILRKSMESIMALKHDRDGDLMISIPSDTRALIESVYSDDRGDDDASIERCRSRHEKIESQNISLANRYLFAAPSTRAFIIGEQDGFIYNESSGESDKYLSARTRVGRDTFPVILLDGNAFRDVIDDDEVPSLQIVRDIYKHIVNMPSYWVQGVSFMPKPKWIRRAHVIRMQDGRWTCPAQDGKMMITITYDDEYGLRNDEIEDW